MQTISLGDVTVAAGSSQDITIDEVDKPAPGDWNLTATVQASEAGDVWVTMSLLQNSQTIQSITKKVSTEADELALNISADVVKSLFGAACTIRGLVVRIAANGSSLESCCPGLPTQLKATIVYTFPIDYCPLWTSPFTIMLDWVDADNRWEGSGSVPGYGTPFGLRLYCGGDSCHGFNVWKKDCADYDYYNLGPPASCQCDPFELVYPALISAPCCDQESGTSFSISITITKDE